MTKMDPSGMVNISDRCLSPTSSLSKARTLFQHRSFKGNVGSFWFRSTQGELAFAVVFTLHSIVMMFIGLSYFSQSIRWEILSFSEMDLDLFWIFAMAGTSF